MDKVATYVAVREEVTAAEVLTNALELDLVTKHDVKADVLQMYAINGLETSCHQQKRSTDW